MKLAEVLDQPVKYDVTSHGDDKFTAQFEIDGNTIYFEAENEEAMHGEDDEGMWSIVFGAKKDGKIVFDITNNRNEFAIFATLKAIIKKFIETCDPKAIHFSADKSDGNRARLYKRLFTKNLPAGWKLSTHGESSDAYQSVFFDIVKESLDRPLPFKITQDESERFVAEFTAGGREIAFRATQYRGEWSVNFVEKIKNGATFRKTGNGKEFEVFSTLKAILEKFIKEKNPKKFLFSADKIDGSRARLYTRMFKKNLPSGWRLDVDDDADEPEVFFQAIHESLDKALPYKVTLNSARGFHADFVAGDRKIRFTADMMSMHPPQWEISFAEVVKNKNGTEYEDMRKTGRGKEFEVFATVKKILNQFIDEKDPSHMTIDSSKAESNRAKLYQRMITKNLPNGWKMDRDDSHPAYNTFVLTKK